MGKSLWKQRYNNERRYTNGDLSEACYKYNKQHFQPVRAEIEHQAKLRHKEQEATAVTFTG